LDCHELATLAQKRADPKGELLQRRNTLLKLIADRQKDERTAIRTVLHVAHTLGAPSTWAKHHNSLRAAFPSIERAATAGRYLSWLWREETSRWRKNPHPLARYEGLVTGFKDVSALVPIGM
jgi:hypothetical protein